MYNLINLNSNSINLKNDGKVKEIPWHEIICIYPSKFSRRPMDFYRIFTIEIEDESKYTFLIAGNKRKAILQEILNHWDSQIDADKVSAKQNFRHSKRWIQKKYKKFWTDSIGMLILLLPLVVIFGIMGNTISQLFIIPFFLICLGIVIKNRITCKKYQGIKSFCIDNNNITWTDERGISRTKSTDDVIRYSLEMMNGKLEFSDQTEILHLEYTTFWPILRKRLLSILT